MGLEAVDGQDAPAQAREDEGDNRHEHEEGQAAIGPRPGAEIS
jgi:hypothetical protein